MLDINVIARLAEKYTVPLEDVLFIALNTNGINLDCDYNRMRTAFRLADSNLFSYAKQRGELDYYFALPVNQKSPFVLVDNTLLLQDTVIGQTIGQTEDICDSHYPRRKGTSLNLNPNSRTSCRGCQFCYTAYQVPYDRKRLKTASDLKDFFEDWMTKYGLTDLSHLIQMSVVTGCYESSDEICQFLRTLKGVLTEYKFTGKIFYLGSQITTKDQLNSLSEIKPFGICLSLETFERRELLRDKKRLIGLQDACESMDFAQELGYEANFAYIVGMESLRVMEYHFSVLKNHVNKFPTINTLQMHKYHEATLMTPDAHRLEYYLEARQLLERLFAETSMRPLVWEDYRSLWFLTFNKEPLYGIRTP
ncbi:MAG: hypothetical protein AUJ28_00565 [Parcubacteria group bacterium CG1_02_37_51]|uniref:Radical SAM core domain-containing protein n=2 Tax=Candidatus Komeiliibacteriota TaxID=1817908 RepID=A0A2M8DQF3_9BACT|nr:MAG: hypothetical protein AUJ28_00565 [Parcubacteria group bacterium CG1_02_37_51]PIY94708.1 MAG: hypothetical protein COY67_02215 [Candidatus Komeilibacteria bacterium CG_4_10_14_0_8_um_filter_37_78]PJC01309.1 MAG: hypothetical protein CO073_03870 [Candidatus Komeilibacteria bacterium CG_4_9_14_0_8_um_filter_36_9]